MAIEKAKVVYKTTTLNTTSTQYLVGYIDGTYKI